MDKIVLLAKGSLPDPYEVVFINDEDGLKIFCNCQAGVHRIWCKHKFELMTGEIGRLQDPGQLPLLKQVESWVASSKLSALIAQYQEKKWSKQLAEQQFKEARERLLMAMNKGDRHWKGEKSEL